MATSEHDTRDGIVLGLIAYASAVVFGALHLSSRRPGVIARVVPMAA